MFQAFLHLLHPRQPQRPLPHGSVVQPFRGAGEPRVLCHDVLPEDECVRQVQRSKLRGLHHDTRLPQRQAIHEQGVQGGVPAMERGRWAGATASSCTSSATTRRRSSPSASPPQTPTTAIPRCGRCWPRTYMASCSPTADTSRKGSSTTSSPTAYTSSLA